jgi:hypothetical protein
MFSIAMESDEKFVKSMLDRAQEKTKPKPQTLSQDVNQKEVEQITTNIRDALQKGRQRPEAKK